MMRRVRAFSLVELLVVVAIIALLISILMPALNRAREQANRTTCLSNLRQIGMGFHMYTADNRGFMPRCAPRPGYAMMDHDWIFYRDRPDGRTIADSPICRYLGSFRPEVFRCPSEDVWTRMTGFQPYYYYSYCMNSYLGTRANLNFSSADTVNLSIVRRPSEMIIAVEEDERSINDGAWGPAWDWLAIRHERERKLPDNGPSSNPQARGNAAFVDGHADYVTRSYAHNRRNHDPTYGN
jgi:prepilin-type N-terminal cleavage/methylation domain-containing protein/prepilin-type processing-associated H-X9-DG protein